MLSVDSINNAIQKNRHYTELIICTIVLIGLIISTHYFMFMVKVEVDNFEDLEARESAKKSSMYKAANYFHRDL